MTTEGDVFVSEYGWSMPLPKDFEQRRGGTGKNRLVKFEPVAFSSAEEPSAMLTWMVAGDSVDEETAFQFFAITSVPGTLPPDQALQAASRIFPVIGRLDEAGVVELPDGRRGLELVETFSQPGSMEVRRGYQLILAKASRPGRAARFERLCFYASADTFNRFVAAIRTASRSFHYTEPQGSNP